MRALTVRQPWAELIASGRKALEFRSWRTSYRGPLLITSALTLDTSPQARSWARELECTLPTGVTICLVDLVGIDQHRGGYAWALEGPRRVDPLHVRGAQGLWMPPFRPELFTPRNAR